MGWFKNKEVKYIIVIDHKNSVEFKANVLDPLLSFVENKGLEVWERYGAQVVNDTETYCVDYKYGVRLIVSFFTDRNSTMIELLRKPKATITLDLLIDILSDFLISFYDDGYKFDYYASFEDARWNELFDAIERKLAARKKNKQNKLPISLDGVNPYKSLYFKEYVNILQQKTDVAKLVVNSGKDVVQGLFSFLCRSFPQTHPLFSFNDELQYIAACNLDDEDSRNYWRTTSLPKSVDLFLEYSFNVLEPLKSCAYENADARALALLAGFACLGDLMIPACEYLYDILFFEHHGIVDDSQRKDILELWVGVAVTVDFLTWYQLNGASYSMSSGYGKDEINNQGEKCDASESSNNELVGTEALKKETDNNNKSSADVLVGTDALKIEIENKKENTSDDKPKTVVIKVKRKKN